MAKKKVLSDKIIGNPYKISPVWQIGILFPDGRKISKLRCTQNEIFETYFIGLDKYLNSNLTAEELLDKYKNTFKSKGIKVAIHYIDSWGHTWKGKEAWPKDQYFIEYLEKRINND